MLLQIQALDEVTYQQFHRLFLYIQQTVKFFYSYSTEYLNQVSFENNICDSLKDITVSCGKLSVIDHEAYWNAWSMGTRVI